MVAKIITGKSLRGALHYNENKVLEGKAELILASGFAGDIERMNFNQKLHRFENLLMLSPNVKTNTLHISLNFDACLFNSLNDHSHCLAYYLALGAHPLYLGQPISKN